MRFFKSLLLLKKMEPSDPKFDECLFELRDLMCDKGNVGVISSIISQKIRIHKLAHIVMVIDMMNHLL